VNRGTWNPTWGARQVRRFQGEEVLAAAMLKGNNEFLQYVRVYANGCVVGVGNDFNNPRHRNDRTIPLVPDQVNRIVLVTRIDGVTAASVLDVNPATMATYEVTSNGRWNVMNIPASEGDFYEADGTLRKFDEASMVGQCQPTPGRSTP
jgi:hypothetical protein